MTRDQLIMQYCDGELGEADSAMVRAWLAEDESARALVAELGLLGDVVRDVADCAPASFDVADSVMARIAAEGSAKRAPALSIRLRTPVRGTQRSVRRSLAVASGALALAAGLWFAISQWGAAPAAKAPLARSSAAVASPVAVAAPVGAIAVPEPAPPEQSVAIERVDFGASQGAIFLVPGSEDRTVVVWTLDDATRSLDDDSDDNGPEVDL